MKCVVTNASNFVLFTKKAMEASFKKLNDILNKETLQIGFAFVNFVTNCFKCCFIATDCTLAS